jgi:hypothetical protein
MGGILALRVDRTEAAGMLLRKCQIFGQLPPRRAEEAVVVADGVGCVRDEMGC